jgi:hypothetical protein
MAIWAWRDKGNLPLVEESTQAQTDKHCQWKKTSIPLLRPKQNKMDGQISNTLRSRICHGRPMGVGLQKGGMSVHFKCEMCGKDHHPMTECADFAKPAADVRFTTEGAEFAIDWLLREIIALNPAGEAHYRKVARAPLPPNAKGQR